MTLMVFQEALQLHSVEQMDAGPLNVALHSEAAASSRRQPRGGGNALSLRSFGVAFWISFQGSKMFTKFKVLP